MLWSGLLWNLAGNVWTQCALQLSLCCNHKTETRWRHRLPNHYFYGLKLLNRPKTSIILGEKWNSEGNTGDLKNHVGWLDVAITRTFFSVKFTVPPNPYNAVSMYSLKSFFPVGVNHNMFQNSKSKVEAKCLLRLLKIRVHGWKRESVHVIVKFGGQLWCNV